MEWSNSPFLQALGWATLNSFWQMALLWGCFAVLHRFLYITSRRSYLLGVSCTFIAFVWFIFTFLTHFLSDNFQSFPLFDQVLISPFLPKLLNGVSIAYLILFIIPAYKTFQNWQNVNFLRIRGLEKAPLHYRLYVRKIALQLGIAKKSKNPHFPFYTIASHHWFFETNNFIARSGLQ